MMESGKRREKILEEKNATTGKRRKQEPCDKGKEKKNRKLGERRHNHSY